MSPIVASTTRKARASPRGCVVPPPPPGRVPWIVISAPGPRSSLLKPEILVPRLIVPPVHPALELGAEADEPLAAVEQHRGPDLADPVPQLSVDRLALVERRFDVARIDQPIDLRVGNDALGVRALAVEDAAEIALCRIGSPRPPAERHRQGEAA